MSSVKRLPRQRIQEKTQNLAEADYFTFNSNFQPKFLDFGPNVPRKMAKLFCEYNDAVDATQPIELACTWSIWEQIQNIDVMINEYRSAIKHVADFSTLEDFFRLYSQIPQPSTLLDNQRIVRDDQGKLETIDAFMIFKKGIRPLWEDPCNSTGGQLVCKFDADKGGGGIDEAWNNLVYAVIGNTLPGLESVNGIRLVDKLAGPRGLGLIRVEAWLQNYEDCWQNVRKAIHVCMSVNLANDERRNVISSTAVNRSLN